MTVIIGMDPHKRSATIEIVDERCRVLAVGMPAKLSAQVRVFATRNGRKTDQWMCTRSRWLRYAPLIAARPSADQSTRGGHRRRL